MVTRTYRYCRVQKRNVEKPFCGSFRVRSVEGFFGTATATYGILYNQNLAEGDQRAYIYYPLRHRVEASTDLTLMRYWTVALGDSCDISQVTTSVAHEGILRSFVTRHWVLLKVWTLPSRPLSVSHVRGNFVSFRNALLVDTLLFHRHSSLHC